jgi:hypothetical protein
MIYARRRYAKALDSIKNLRKERVSDLKADQARLAGLKQEKDRADDVKKNLADTRTIIANKETAYEELKNQYNAQVISNKQFYEHSTKFRETYIHVENLVKQKGRLQEDYKELKLNLQELAGEQLWLSRANNTHDIDIDIAQVRTRNSRHDSTISTNTYLSKNASCREKSTSGAILRKGYPTYDRSIQIVFLGMENCLENKKHIINRWSNGMS